MTEEIKKVEQIEQRARAATPSGVEQLSDSELDQIAGGGPAVRDATYVAPPVIVQPVYAAYGAGLSRPKT